MSPLPGFHGPSRPLPQTTPVEQVLMQVPLQRVLRFAGHSIDDVVNCPIAKRQVLHLYKVGRKIARQDEIDELERQWNPLGRRI